MDDGNVAFGAFRLIPAQRMLLRDGVPLHLSSRALDILIALVESAGETIPKERLISRAWPDTVVGEAALRVHVAALRKALGGSQTGTRYVANVPGRGYSFVAPLALRREQPAPARPDAPTLAGNLPMPLTRFIGRDTVISTLSTRLAERRLLTIIGPGGIGKTRTAVAVAEVLTPSFRDGLLFVDLGSLSDPNLVLSGLGAALGISLIGIDPLTGLKEWLRGKHALIVFDSCERVITTAASLAEELLRVAPQVHILATSREPLRAEAEWLYRLVSLAVPPRSTAPTIEAALHYSAIELFVERAAASAGRFPFGPADLPAITEICRRLDGVPLALELAAAQVGVLSIKTLTARLDDPFAVLTNGRRTAPARHQSLRAAMDWTYDSLPQAEQLILQRLSVFRADFTMDAAIAVAADNHVSTADVFDGVRNLVMKSLVATDINGDPTFYRLLHTTRLYALERLAESGEPERLRRRHDEFYRELFELNARRYELQMTG